MKKVVLVMIFLILALIMAIPASASPPKDIDITSESRFFLNEHFYNPDVTWDAMGVVESSGWSDGALEHFGAGWPDGKGFQTAHTVNILADDQGTMTIRVDAHGFDFYPQPDPDNEGEYIGIDACLDLLPDGLTKPYDEPYDECYHGSGNWRILSGTGAYAGLHGQGRVTIIGFADWSADIMDSVEVYHGMAHFDPN